MKIVVRGAMRRRAPLAMRTAPMRLVRPRSHRYARLLLRGSSASAGAVVHARTRPLLMRLDLGWRPRSCAETRSMGELQRGRPGLGLLREPHWSVVVVVG